MSEHKFVAAIDWAKVRNDVSDRTMASLGLRPLALGRNITVRGDDGAEWEYVCGGCGIKTRYLTRGTEPDLSRTCCPNCREKK